MDSWTELAGFTNSHDKHASAVERYLSGVEYSQEAFAEALRLLEEERFALTQTKPEARKRGAHSGESWFQSTLKSRK